MRVTSTLNQPAQLTDWDGKRANEVGLFLVRNWIARWLTGIIRGRTAFLTGLGGAQGLEDDLQVREKGAALRIF